MFDKECYIKAFDYAVKAHKDQKTPKGAPYLSHLVKVTTEVLIACEEAELQESKCDLAIMCALLHDTIEDTDVTFDDLYTVFGDDVAYGVEALSKNPELPKNMQMGDSMNKLLEQPYEVQLVKLADRVVNLSKPPKDWSKTKKVSYLKEAKFILSCIRNSNLYLSLKLQEKIEEYQKYIEDEK